MKIKKLLTQGFLLWLTVFFSSFLIFPIKQSNPVYFETVITIFLVTASVLFSIWLFNGVTEAHLRAGIVAGVAWMLVNIVLDSLFFSWGPMKKSISDYMLDIGLTYLVIPAITVGMGYMLDKKSKKDLI